MIFVGVNIPKEKRAAVNDAITQSIDYVIFCVFLDSPEIDVFCMNFPRAYSYKLDNKPALILGSRVEENDTEEIMDKFLQELKDAIMQTVGIDLEILGFDFRTTTSGDNAPEAQEVIYHFESYHVA